MKKLLCILMASLFIAFAASGCGKTEEQNTASETAEEESARVLNALAPGTYSTNDFTLYTLDDENYLSETVAALGVAPDSVEPKGDSAIEAFQGITMKTGVVRTTDDSGRLSEHNVVNYYSYDGSRVPLATVKGVVTTGIYITDTDKDCSTADEVIKAYEIDEENEEYKTNVNDDSNYTIDLYFQRSTDDGSTERIVSSKGTDISALNAGYSLRFYIVNGYVHGISAQMY